MSFTTCLIVALGGALGTVARYLAGLAALPFSQSLPWGTVGINVVGSFVIGFFGTLTLADGRFPVPENVRLFVMVGFCGGFTTFSAFSLQTLDLLRGGTVGRAGANIGGAGGVCLLAGTAGHLLAARMNSGAKAIAQVEIEEG